MTIVALYARVSSEKQANADTIASQITALENRISADGYSLLDEFKFIDNGYSGSHLIRPGLEKLRDKVSGGEIDKIYIHSPDRLSRKYAYQMILIEEFQKSGAEIIFLNYQTDDSPESHLLLQMQGMIAEYERAKIMERHRRGKIHAAKRGSVSVLCKAPYGYHYINKHMGGGQALYEIDKEKSEVVRNIFSWVGCERLGLQEICRRLEKMNIPSPKGNLYWDKSSVFMILRNPTYKGTAAFGKRKMGKALPRIRPQRGSCEQPARGRYSTYSVDKENWIYIPVPAIVDANLFATVQEQLEENRKLMRLGKRGATYLLQGLTICQHCQYAYCGTYSQSKQRGKIYRHTYYRCSGKMTRHFDNNKICNNKQIRSDILETAVWEEIKFLLKNPKRISGEYQRRILELEKSPLDHTRESLEKQEQKLKRGISRLIDSYSQEHIDKEEFEPRIKAMKYHLKILEEQKQKVVNEKNLKKELTLIITNLEYFTACIKSKLEEVDWLTKRDIIRTLVKRIEINQEDINVVFRIQELPSPSGGVDNNSSESLQDCLSGYH